MSFEIHQSFMVGYVRRINLATFKVTIGGVRIGEARYSRLAQINLHSRVITFSRFAIENVPERGRRYLVLHELAHVLEPDHNKRFWALVAQHEPSYKEIGRQLDKAFHKNVRDEKLRIGQYRQSDGAGTMQPGLLSAATLAVLKDGNAALVMNIDDADCDDDLNGSGGCFGSANDELGSWSEIHEGIVCGGADLDI